MKRVILVLAAMAAGCASTGRPTEAPRAECGREAGFEFCIHTPAQGSKTVLYFMHQGGKDHTSWGSWNVAKEFYRDLEARGVPPPTVVAVSFGTMWLLTEGTPAPGGFLRRFTEEIMPFIEKRTGAPERRLLWGMSMGGFNAAQLLLKRPELWKAAVLSCPAVVDWSPSRGRGDLDAYVARTGADRRKAEWMWEQTGKLFPEAGSWESHDPVRLAAKTSALPPLLVECGDKDEWGFFEGARRLTDALTAAGARVRFERTPGRGHCAVTLPPILDFLQASLPPSGGPASARAAR